MLNAEAQVAGGLSHTGDRSLNTGLPPQDRLVRGFLLEATAGQHVEAG